jgi:hypothetical protein
MVLMSSQHSEYHTANSHSPIRKPQPAKGKNGKIMVAFNVTLKGPRSNQPEVADYVTRIVQKYKKLSVIDDWPDVKMVNIAPYMDGNRVRFVMTFTGDGLKNMNDGNRNMMASQFINYNDLNERLKIKVNNEDIYEIHPSLHDFVYLVRIPSDWRKISLKDVKMPALDGVRAPNPRKKPQPTKIKNGKLQVAFEVKLKAFVRTPPPIADYAAAIARKYAFTTNNDWPNIKMVNVSPYMVNGNVTFVMTLTGTGLKSMEYLAKNKMVIAFITTLDDQYMNVKGYDYKIVVDTANFDYIVTIPPFWKKIAMKAPGLPALDGEHTPAASSKKTPKVSVKERVGWFQNWGTRAAQPAAPRSSDVTPRSSSFHTSISPLSSSVSIPGARGR